MMATRAASFWRQFRRNRAAVFGLGIIAVVVVMAALAPLLYPQGALKIVGSPLIWPFTDARHPLGTDGLGRDISAILFHGARITLLVGLVAAAIAILTGTAIGALSGYYGGWIDVALMRVTDVFQTIPGIVFLLALVSSLGPDLANVTVGIGLVSWTGIARLTRAQFLSLKTREFILASRALGVRNHSIILREILPNALPPVIVMGSLVIASAVLWESALAFLGFTDPDVASWGRLMGDGRPLLRSAWFVCAVPGVAILLAVLALNLIGDGINDALNPRLRNAVAPSASPDDASAPAEGSSAGADGRQ